MRNVNRGGGVPGMGTGTGVQVGTQLRMRLRARPQGQWVLVKELGETKVLRAVKERRR